MKRQTSTCQIINYFNSISTFLIFGITQISWFYASDTNTGGMKYIPKLIKQVQKH
jgi:hypothetical protein